MPIDDFCIDKVTNEEALSNVNLILCAVVVCLDKNSSIFFAMVGF